MIALIMPGYTAELLNFYVEWVFVIIGWLIIVYICV